MEETYKDLGCQATDQDSAIAGDEFVLPCTLGGERKERNKLGKLSVLQKQRKHKIRILITPFSLSTEQGAFELESQVLITSLYLHLLHTISIANEEK